MLHSHDNSQLVAGGSLKLCPPNLPSSARHLGSPALQGREDLTRLSIRRTWCGLAALVPKNQVCSSINRETPWPNQWTGMF